MGGFLNLIEGFLAFALTMLALSTAVSAIVEVGLSLFRWRRKGLRDMISYLFREKIKGRYLESPPGVAPASGGSSEKGTLSRIREWVARTARNLVLRSLGLHALSPKQWEDDQSGRKKTARTTAAWSEAQVAFIMETCMTPSSQHGAAMDEDMRREQVLRAESWGGIPMLPASPKWARTGVRVFLNWLIRAINWPLRLFVIWPSLKYAMSNLPSAEFQAKFERSSAGKRIKEEQPYDWERICSDLVDEFKLLEGAATERFRSKLRYLSVLVGFVLAFAINIDSFDLLNSYLTNPELRAAVIEKSDTVLRQAETGLEVAAPQTTAGQHQAQLASRMDTLAQALRDVRGSGALGSAGQARLDEAIALAEQSKQTVGEMKDEFARSYAQVRDITNNLTESFPIGWTRYPKCPKGSPDARCLAVRERGGKTPAPDSVAWVDVLIRPPGDVFTGSWGWFNIVRTIVNFVLYLVWGLVWLLALPVSAVHWFHDILYVYFENDPQGFFRWFAGTLTTGILVGLGSPFWVGAVKNLMAARSMAKGLSKSTSAVGESPAEVPAKPATTPPAPRSSLEQ